MPRKPLFRPCDTVSSKSKARYKEFTKPLLGPEALRVIGRAYDKGIITKEDADASAS